MTNTPPTSPNDGDANGRADAASPTPEAPVFDDVTTERPEVQDAAPELVEPSDQPDARPEEQVTETEVTAADAPREDATVLQGDRQVDAEPVPLVEPAAPEPVSVRDVPPTAVTPAPAPLQDAPVQDAPGDAYETAGYDEHIEEPRVGEPEPQVPVAPPVQTVYVSAPVAPKKKGNRAYGILFAFLGTLAFAVLFAAVIALILLIVRPENAFGGSIVGFISTSAFWVPVAVFFVLFALFALIVNRGGWVAWVLSSFIIAVAVYLISIGVILLLEGVFGMTPDEANRGFGQLALSAPLITAGILAREVTIWFSAAIAARGRKVKERNLEARAAYERELDNQPLGFS